MASMPLQGPRRSQVAMTTSGAGLGLFGSSDMWSSGEASCLGFLPPTVVGTAHADAASAQGRICSWCVFLADDT